MKRKSLFAAAGALIVAASCLFAGNAIRAGLSVSNDILKPGETVTVPIRIDLTGLSENLGSYTAALSWNPRTLRYVSAEGAEGPFANPVLNESESGQGLLKFAAADPQGARGKVGLLNVAFEVIGAEGEAAELDLEFTAMAAARSFKDLLPELQVDLEDLKIPNAAPTSFSLSQNHPNPFNPATRITFSVPEASRVRVEIYNLLGEKVRTLVDGEKKAGRYDLLWDSKDGRGVDMPAGVYLIQMKAGSFSDMKKMMLVK